jgi:hypothetical protein
MRKAIDRSFITRLLRNTALSLALMTGISLGRPGAPETHVLSRSLQAERDGCVEGVGISPRASAWA